MEEMSRKPGSNRGVCQSRGSRFPPENKVRTYVESSGGTFVCLSVCHISPLECLFVSQTIRLTGR